MKTHYIVFKSDPNNIRLVKLWLDEIAILHCLTETIYPNILITLTEAVNNAIIHGNKCDINKDIKLWCDVKENKIKFIVRDEGDGFDWNNIPDPRTCERVNLENGRGVLIMQSLAHKVKYRKQGANVEITFKIHKIHN
ncbi:MAG: ATP-binding protein [Deltaproteobacteria bacterium]